MAKPDRTTTPALPASKSVTVDTPSRGVESEPVAAETAKPKRTKLADGTEYLVRPVKHDEPVVTMSNRRRRELEAGKSTTTSRSTEDAGTASVNSSEAKANG